MQHHPQPAARPAAAGADCVSVSAGPRQARRQRLHPLTHRLLGWLVERDRGYREKRHVESLSDDLLRDIGLDRTERNRGFYRRYGQMPEDYRESQARLHMPW